MKPDGLGGTRSSDFDQRRQTAISLQLKLLGRFAFHTIVGVVLFCLVATAVYLVMEIYAGFWPTQAQAFLASTRVWIDTHTDQVIIVVSLVLGLWLIGKSAYLLVT